jgi:alpha-galactosidase
MAGGFSAQNEPGWKSPLRAMKEKWSRKNETDMTSNRRAVSVLAGIMASIHVLAAQAATIPLNLPKPDDKPGNPKKPIKVYILAGQSNMVGMGNITGAQPPYPTVYLSADPAIIPGLMPVGGSAIARHGMCDAKATVYSGRQPVKTVPVALGTVAEKLPATEGTQTVEVTAQIEVPVTGSYLIHAGFGESSQNTVTLNDQPVTGKVTLEAGKRYPVRISYQKAGSAAFWLQQVDIPAHGDLVTITKRDQKFQYLIDDAGNWMARNDVLYADPRLFPDRAVLPLSATANNGKSIGPEVGFGYVLGTFHDEQVLLIKTAIGNRSIDWDFRPPSSGKTDRPGAAEWEGLEYRLLVKGVRDILARIDKVVPGYQGRSYEVAGFGWFQGHKDKGASKEQYERHLVNLINDLRKEFNAPKMPAVVATVGFNGYRLASGPWNGVWEAQMAVGDPKQHPEFAATVASVDTRDFWREREESPQGEDYHYNRNAETYLLVGEAMGRAMVRLEGGEAEAIPKSDREAKVAAEMAAAKSEPTAEQASRMCLALRPIVLDRLVPDFLATAFGANSRSLPRLEVKALLKGEKPKRMDVGIESQIDTLMSYYEAAGISDYGWHAFGPEMKTAKWFYYSFDPPEKQDLAKSDRYRKITFPAGMENWFAPDFDPVKAGWKEGAAPFGQWDGKLEARRPSCNGPLCGCSTPPATLWEKEVLLMRQTFDLPPVKKGHVYRCILGGAGCDRSGEGFAIYVNGKLLTQVNGGFYKTPGIRGAYVYSDCLPEFKGGEVTIAVVNFLRYTHFNNSTTYFGPRIEYKNKPVPPNGHVSLWLEEAQVSPAALEAFEGTK